MKKVYIDTSAFVKLFYTKEVGSDIVKQLFELANAKRIHIVISFWAANEALAAVDRLYHKRKLITRDQRNVIIATIIRRIKSWSEPKATSGSTPSITCVYVDNDLVKASREFILVSHISADDALHLYSGHAKDCDYFVHRDRKLKDVGEKIDDMKLVNVSVQQQVSKLFDELDLES